MSQPYAPAERVTEVELDVLAQRFFEPEREAERARAKADRRALRAVLAMLGLFGLGLAAFVLYARLVMPMPAEIGLERNIDLPPRAAD
jgi:hypothetical protein